MDSLEVFGSRRHPRADTGQPHQRCALGRLLTVVSGLLASLDTPPGPSPTPWWPWLRFWVPWYFSWKSQTDKENRRHPSPKPTHRLNAFLGSAHTQEIFQFFSIIRGLRQIIKHQTLLETKEALTLLKQHGAPFLSRLIQPISHAIPTDETGRSGEFESRKKTGWLLQSPMVFASRAGTKLPLAINAWTRFRRLDEKALDARKSSKLHKRRGLSGDAFLTNTLGGDLFDAIHNHRRATIFAGLGILLHSLPSYQHRFTANFHAFVFFKCRNRPFHPSATDLRQ